MDAARDFVGQAVESDFDYYSRRALEEGHAAARAANPVTAAAHRRMAVVYASLLAEDLPPDPELDDLLRQLD